MAARCPGGRMGPCGRAWQGPVLWNEDSERTSLPWGRTRVPRLPTRLLSHPQAPWVPAGEITVPWPSSWWESRSDFTSSTR